MKLQREKHFLDVGFRGARVRKRLFPADRVVLLVLDLHADAHRVAAGEIRLGNLDVEDAVDFLAVVEAVGEQVVDRDLRGGAAGGAVGGRGRGRVAAQLVEVRGDVDVGADAGVLDLPSRGLGGGELGGLGAVLRPGRGGGGGGGGGAGSGGGGWGAGFPGPAGWPPGAKEFRPPPRPSREARPPALRGPPARSWSRRFPPAGRAGRSAPRRASSS